MCGDLSGEFFTAGCGRDEGLSILFLPRVDTVAAHLPSHTALNLRRGGEIFLKQSLFWIAFNLERPILFEPTALIRTDRLLPGLFAFFHIEFIYHKSD